MFVEIGVGLLLGAGCASYAVQRHMRKRYDNTIDQQISAVTAAGHSLRSHLNNILGQSQLLSDRAKNYRSEDKNLISNVLDSSGELRRILLDTLEIIELNTHILRLDPKECVLYNTLDQIICTQHLRALRQGIALDIEISDSTKRRYEVDAMRLQQCIDSILTQCLFQTQGTNLRITIKIAKSKKNRHYIVFQLTDTSIKLQKYQVDAYFSPGSFHCNHYLNKDSSSRLSLLLSHQLATKMGGSLRARPLSKEGVEFILRLPVKYSGTLRKSDELVEPVAPDTDDVTERFEAAPTPEKNISDVRLLVVDDNPTNLMIIEGLLSMMGYRHITTTTKGQEALDFLSTDHIDAVLTDIDMPDMDGIELTRQIRSSHASWSDIPIIAVSASTSSADRELVASAGTTGFVSKPILRDELCVVLAEQLAHPPQLQVAAVAI